MIAQHNCRLLHHKFLVLYKPFEVPPWSLGNTSVKIHISKMFKIVTLNRVNKIQKKNNVRNLNNSPQLKLNIWNKTNYYLSDLVIRFRRALCSLTQNKALFGSVSSMCAFLSTEKKLIKEHLLFWLTQRKSLINFYSSIKTEKELKNSVQVLDFTF